MASVQGVPRKVVNKGHFKNVVGVQVSKNQLNWPNGLY